MVRREAVSKKGRLPLHQKACCAGSKDAVPGSKASRTGCAPTRIRSGVGRTVASHASASRKVRAPQGRVPGNSWAARADGQCNREQTAERHLRMRVVRVKGCGKSAPRTGPTPYGTVNPTRSKTK